MVKQVGIVSNLHFPFSFGMDEETANNEAPGLVKVTISLMFKSLAIIKKSPHKFCPEAVGARVRHPDKRIK